ncbi:MAG: hypothetical protein GX638_00775 [Crenarchaeota archaeon]|nr:hypothetical protein [Thermoproteota archaeon]
MKQLRINCKEDELYDIVVPIVKNKIFHFTTYRNFNKIKRCGKIVPNSDGEFKSLLSNHNSYGFKNKWISLFDFSDSNYIEDTYSRYDFCKFDSKGYCVYLMLDAEKIKEILIPNSVALANNGWCIPNTECWLPSPIGFDLINEVYIVKITEYSEITKLFRKLKN